MQLPTLALILSAAFNILARERPINTDHPTNNDLPNDPSLLDAFENVAATVTFDSDDLDLAGDIESFGDINDMDVDMSIPLEVFGIPPLKVTRPGFQTSEGDHGCSYSYTIENETFPLFPLPIP